MTVLLCPGQGAQVIGMGADFARAFPASRRIFDRADEALGTALSKTIFGGAQEDLNRTDVAQPAILTTTAAILAALEVRGLVDRSALTHVAGLSLGEYTAHYVAGSLGFEDAVRLVRTRGQAMQAASDATPSAMAAVLRADVDVVSEACAAVVAEGGVCVVANLNCPGQVVISGENGALERCCELLAEAGQKRVKRLPVAGAFHSPVMQPAAEALREALAAVDFADPKVPVVCNVAATPVTDAAQARDTLARQVVAPVLFEKSLRWLIAAGDTDFVEPGPGAAATGFLKKIDRGITVRGYSTVEHAHAEEDR